MFKTRQVAIFLLLGAVAWADTPVSLVSRGKGVIEPVFPVQFKVEQESGTAPKRAEFMKCRAVARKQILKVEGQEFEIVQIVFECANDRRFIIKEVLFEAVN